MKVQQSEFIKEKRPLLLRLRDLLVAEYDYASILAMDSQARRYDVSRMNMNANEQELLSSRGFVVRVNHHGRWVEYSFNLLSEETLEDVINQIRELVQTKAALPEGLSENRYTAPASEPSHFSGSTDYELDPEALGDEAILERLVSLKNRGLAVSDRILDFQVRFVYQKYTKLFLAKDRELLQNVMWSNGAMLSVASRGDEMKTAHKSFSCLGGAELLKSMEGGVEDCVRTGLELLESLPVEPGEYDCVCTPAVTGLIVHEAFGHGVEMDMFVKKRALAENFIGQYVASPLVTMHDGGATEAASYFFDDEGIMASDTLIIDKGVLKQGINDLLSAQALGVNPSGNGRRQDYRRKAYTRMTNTWFEGGHGKVEDMIASIRYGFLLDGPASGMEDPKNWGIQCMVNIAREIRDGRLTGRVFSPVVLTGYVPDLLKSITAMSETVALSGSGFCGKGHKEIVKAADGGPYIKARIRLG